MIPYIQSSEDNCFGTCIASIFEVDPEEIPNYIKDADWFEKWYNYLAKRNIRIHTHYYCKTSKKNIPQGYVIFGVKRSKDLHAVVGYDGQIVWEPSPNKCEFKEKDIVDYTYFTIMNPSKFKFELR